MLGIGDQAELQRTIDEEKRLSAPLMQTGGGVIGNLINNGSVAATAVPGRLIAKGAMAIPRRGSRRRRHDGRSIATATGIGAATGGVQGALEPVATGESIAQHRRRRDDRRGRWPLARCGVARGETNTAPEVQQLIDEGVQLTPGQTAGGVLKAHRGCSYVDPRSSGIIKRLAQTPGIEDFNRAGFNRALAPIGEKVGPDFAVGREGYRGGQAKIGQTYDRALNKIKIVQFDPQLRRTLPKAQHGSGARRCGLPSNST